MGELKGNQREWDGRMIRVAAKMHLECSRASYDPIRTADGMTIPKKKSGQNRRATLVMPIRETHILAADKQEIFSNGRGPHDPIRAKSPLPY